SVLGQIESFHQKINQETASPSATSIDPLPLYSTSKPGRYRASQDQSAKGKPFARIRPPSRRHRRVICRKVRRGSKGSNKEKRNRKKQPLLRTYKTTSAETKRRINL
ncbi:unnamed protein product, partial [Musa acuminata subsp. burmannicoides]